MQTLFSPALYHDPEVFAREQSLLFGGIWHYVGFTHELATPNDFVTRDIGGRSVLVQNFDGTLRAYTNVCSHRFNRIHAACKGNGKLRCGYHGWMYDAEGVPTVIPKRPRFEGLTPEKLQSLRLESWRVEVCGRLVFVCRSLDAPGLREFLGASYETVERMTLAYGPLIDEDVLMIHANWKLLIENSLESYHVHFVHPNSFDRLGTSAGIFEWQSPHSSWSADLNAQLNARMEKFMAVFSTRPFKVSGYFHQLIFPNLALATLNGTSFSFQVYEPQSPDLTRFTTMLFQTQVDAATKSAVIETLNQSAKEFNRVVVHEDKDICEQVHLGARVTDKLGLLSDEELRVLDFQKQYTDWIDLKA
jgi:phenylpropionate dioxygenase-like ring-hydroxylating dioxygenase large terminal subunit